MVINLELGKGNINDKMKERLWDDLWVGVYNYSLDIKTLVAHRYYYYYLLT